MKLLQINTTVNSGSTGRIAEEIGKTALDAGMESVIAGAYTNRPSQSGVITIGNHSDRILHGLKSRLFDRHGFGSAGATRILVRQIAELKPDIIHLHNIHGYYLNIEILFGFLKVYRKPVVWTLHDCWSFTGHCAYFDRASCLKWTTECNHCPLISGYPASWFADASEKNYRDKKRLFNSVKAMTLVTPSKWLAGHVSHSFLSLFPIKIIHNGINLFDFSPIKSTDHVRNKYKLPDKAIILGVASTWDQRKGLHDFVLLSKKLKLSEHIVLLGLSPGQISNLPENITGVGRTENISELAALYSLATVFVNPTHIDNFPTTNIEALSCGTPVITYDTGGSPEAIDEDTGFVIEKGDIDGLYRAIRTVINQGKDQYTETCRTRTEQHFDKDKQFGQYLDLYKELLKVNPE